FVDLKANAVAGGMNKPDPAVFAAFGLITCLRERALDRVMNLLPAAIRANRAQADLLAPANRRHQAGLFIARRAAQEGPGHVTEIAAVRHAREDVDDDKFVRTQRTAAATMRIT